MKESDLILSTGGSGLVKSAYSSGKPAIGVGPGNCPAIIDTSANLKMAIASIIQSNTFDNGMICATENSVIALQQNYNAVISEFVKQQAFIVTKKDDIKKIKNKMFSKGTNLLNPEIVGKDAKSLSKVFDIKVPS
jgi:acetaldehyde dehydrogenase/alcohol dehydrogenase